MEDTRWFGPSSAIEIVDQTDGLLIRITHIKRKGYLVIALAIVFASSIFLAWRESLGGFVVLGIALLWIASWFIDRKGEIRVTENYLMSEGNSLVRLAWSEIRVLEYGGGGEDEPTGLYARVGRWRSVCVRANLNREQTEEIIAAIYHRFPSLKLADESEPLGTRFRSLIERWRGSKKNTLKS